MKGNHHEISHDNHALRQRAALSPGTIATLEELGLTEPTIDLDPVDAAAHRAKTAYVAKLSPEELAARRRQLKHERALREPSARHPEQWTSPPSAFSGARLWNAQPERVADPPPKQAPEQFTLTEARARGVR